jgi:hypothetical protein
MLLLGIGVAESEEVTETAYMIKRGKDQKPSLPLGRIGGHDAKIEVVSSYFLIRLHYSGGFVKAKSRPTSATTYRPVGFHLNICLKHI